MKSRQLVSAIKIFSLCLALGAAGTANARTIDLGTIGAGTYDFTEYVRPGKTFTDYVRFSADDALQLTAFVKSFDLSILSFDLLGIDNFSATLQQLGSGGFHTISSLTSNPISFDDLLSPGKYRIAIGGTSSGFIGGLYRGTLQVAAVPEADVWVMMLVGFGVVLYQLSRKQRSLEQLPVAA